LYEITRLRISLGILRYENFLVVDGRLIGGRRIMGAKFVEQSARCSARKRAKRERERERESEGRQRKRGTVRRDGSERERERKRGSDVTRK